jgi:para-aminobenzoate synthetase component 1
LDLPTLGRLRAERVSLPPPGPELLQRLAGVPHLALLDSAAGGRFTLVASSPLARLTWRPGHGEISMPGGARAREDDFSALLREACLATHEDGGSPLPLGPGWIGYLGYGLRRAFEEVPERHGHDAGIPDVALAYHAAVVIHDAQQSTWWSLWRDGAADLARTLLACLRRASPAPDAVVDGAPLPCIEKAAYLDAVRRAVEYIYAGDVFQVNYAHEFRAPFRGHPLALYLRLRAHNPAPYCAFLDLGGGRAVLSTSPELFLELEGGRVLTRPIKGTRPRGSTEAEDAALIEELRRSEKDTAELAMIVDLERNDLGRVCRPGSVEVVEEACIESYASVHHRVATVRGELERGRDRADLLAATFPGGSITGAPKIRAMEIIDELEAGRRGAYTGSIGILTDPGGMALNIAIRTAVVAGDRVSLHVGGGIVADSDPEAEHEETLAKGRAIFEALSS